jgi:hypothetical protein
VRKGRSRVTLIVLTVIAAPIALVFESLLRFLLFPDDFERVRTFLEPYLTPVAWGLAIVTLALSFVGYALQKRISTKRVARIPEPKRTPERIERAKVGAFMLTASIPQIPAIVATFTVMFGASIVPAIVAIVIVTAAVLAIGRLTRADPS